MPLKPDGSAEIKKISKRESKVIDEIFFENIKTKLKSEKSGSEKIFQRMKLICEIFWRQMNNIEFD